MCMRVIVSHHYVNNKFLMHHHLTVILSWLCDDVWDALSFQLFHIQQIIVVCHWIWIESNIYKQTNIILYGGSLGSLFDEERSKVRESNANCRTHWAWITRTHLAAKTQSRLNLLQSCLHNIKFICLSNKEMNCWQVQWNLTGFDLACKTYLTYMIFHRISCIRVNTKLYTIHKSTYLCWFVSVVITWEIFIISVLLTAKQDASKHVYTCVCVCIEDVWENHSFFRRLDLHFSSLYHFKLKSN